VVLRGACDDSKQQLRTHDSTSFMCRNTSFVNVLAHHFEGRLTRRK
jgi:hypothetical protein